MAYVGRKSGNAALISADIPSNLHLLGDYVKIPSATTTERDALTPAVGMMLYNTTLGIMQQYSASGWASIDSPPTVSSFTYPNGTALDPAGSTTATLVITGTNFQTGVTVAIDGTAPTATTRNSSTQITITGFPAKSAATYANGLVVTNPTGLTASVDIAYDAVPAWTTASGSLGTFVDGAYTNSSTSTIRIVAAEASDTIDYAQVSDSGGGTIITSGVAGLTLGTTGANAGYLTGTLAGTDSTTYTFYAKAQDDENQFSAVRSFNIITRDYAATGGTIISSLSGYKIHKWTTVGTNQDGGAFVVNVPVTIDYIVIAGGGSAGTCAAGGGGAGGVRIGTSLALSAGTYQVIVGDGGAGVTPIRVTGNNGSVSSLTAGSLISATGGGAGAGGDGGTGGSWANNGGSGGGGSSSTTAAYRVGGSGVDSGSSGAFGTATYQGHDGGTTNNGGSAHYEASGGGGSGAVGQNATMGSNAGDGGDGINTFWGMSAANTTLFLAAASAGVVQSDDSNYRYLAGGGGGTTDRANASDSQRGIGGRGGGGDGAGETDRANGAGVDGTGSGSGGSYGSGDSLDGGSGIVIIRYAV